ncbi:hypothetical protein [Anabaena sp. AL93]|uniref:hypothetical protein n=1 Tax=Anabaena sp. AL93 TaxID=1678133 RepID=UPI0025C70E40|nr:hypothetical protein [Anabaena sp. AL93]
MMEYYIYLHQVKSPSNPVHPKILVILILTTTINNLQIGSQGINSLSKSSSRFKPTIGNDGILYLFSSGKKSIKSCTSLNPGNPDSDNHNKQSPNSENVTLPIC